MTFKPAVGGPNHQAAKMVQSASYSERGAQLVYAVADVLCQELFRMPDKKVRGCAETRYTVGDFWKFECDMVVISDAITDDEATFFVRIVGNLWAYVISNHKGVFLMYFDGDRAKVRVGDLTRAARGSARETLKVLAPTLRDGYFFPEGNSISAKWLPLNVGDLVSKLGAGNPAPSPAASSG